MAAQSKGETRDERVLVLAPTGRDAALASSILEREGFHASSCASMDDLCQQLDEGAGAVLLAEEALSPPAGQRLAEAISAQPPWSDIPLVVFCGGEMTAAANRRTIATIAPLGNVTLLDRPARIITLVSSLQVALRARRRQYQVRDLLVQLEGAVNDRDRFLAMLSHELRNPLAAIVYGLDLLDKSGVADDSLAPQRRMIDRQVRHLNRLVDDLLDVARVTSGKIQLSCVAVSLPELVARCAESAAASTTHGVGVAYATGPEPLLVFGDPVRLEQVVMNLLTNAIKYTPDGGTVKVSIERDGDRAVISIADTGIGIAPEMLPRVFDLFTQVESSLARSRGGLGIGLTLVQSLVRLHGGAVHASSAGVGRGSRFSVTLPLLDGPHGARQTSEKRAGRGSPRIASRHIVIIEDNADIRECLQLLLETSGHRVAVAEDGPSGVTVVLTEKPDVVLVDVGLPGLDGYGVARAIRSALGHGIFLAAVTGYGQPEDQKRALDVGFDAHLTKPVTVDAVEKLLARAPQAPP